MIKTSRIHPSWATRHKRPGTELRCIKDRYYLYEYKTVYDASKKRARKISGKILGSITQQAGFIPSAKRMVESSAGHGAASSKKILVKEFGMARLVSEKFLAYGKKLENYFGALYKELLAIAYCRFVYKCPLKNIPFRLESSFLPELLSFSAFNEKTASGILNKIGAMTEAMQDYMKSFIDKSDYILIDATHVLSHSQQMPIARRGYNTQLNFDTQFNLLYIYSATGRMPVFYRLLPGNIREVKAFKNILLQAGLKKSIIVADKGFYSKANIDLLVAEKLQFILPLKRDNQLIDYQSLTSNTFKGLGTFFIHEKRTIWCRRYVSENMLLHLFLDESLRVKEENDYLTRITTHPEEYSMKGYHEKRNTLGSLALLTNIKSENSEEIYQTYKSRMEIEVMFDGMKNVLEADHTYMQNQQTLEGWMFINHLCLQWYQQLYIELKEKKLLKKISVNDYIYSLTDIKKVNINGTWHLNEFTHATAKLLKAVGIQI